MIRSRSKELRYLATPSLFFLRDARTAIGYLRPKDIDIVYVYLSIAYYRSSQGSPLLWLLFPGDYPFITLPLILPSIFYFSQAPRLLRFLVACIQRPFLSSTLNNVRRKLHVLKIFP